MAAEANTGPDAGQHQISTEFSRNLSLLQITMMGVGIMIGAGVFLGVGNAGPAFQTAGHGLFT
ncbi:MAG: hypothetical protein V3S89_06355 [Desulfobacterales bacterium]